MVILRYTIKTFRLIKSNTAYYPIPYVAVEITYYSDDTCVSPIKLKPSTFTNPEADFIIQCLRSELLPGSGDIKQPPDLNWDEVFRLLEENRLAPHFSVFAKKHEGMFPYALRKKLTESRYANLLYGDQCKKEVKEVLEGLTGAGIPVIVMKGWVLIQWLYHGDHGQRFCEDIDILVPKSFVPQAEEKLGKLGYGAVEEVDPGYSHRFSNAQAYQKVNHHASHWRQFAIGFHWGLTHVPYYDESRINTDDLFSRSCLIRVAGVEVAELSFEDQLVYTCAHLALHHRNTERLLNYFEIAAIIQRAGGEMDWQAVVDRAVKWRYITQVKHVLAEVQQLWPGVIPVPGLERVEKVQPTLQDRWIDRLVASTKGNRFRSALVEVLALPGWKNKFFAAFRHIFPDQDYMRHRYGISKKHLFSAYWNRVASAVSGLFRSRVG